MKKNTSYIIGVIVCSLVLFEVLYFMILAFAPVRVIDVKQPLRVVTKQVYPGGNFEYVIDYCKYGDYGATVIRSISCITKEGKSYNYQYPSGTGTVTGQGCRQTHVIIQIPLTAQPGVCQLTTRPTYQVNAIRQYSITSRSESFNIIK